MRLDLLRYQVLINTLTHEARTRPNLYHFRVALWIFWGYFYLFFLLFVSIALLIGLVVLAIFLFQRPRGTIHFLILLGPVAIALLGFIFSICRSLFMKIEEPEGLYLERGNSIELFRDIDLLRERMNVPVFDEVLLDGDYNASISQVPRFGILGGHKNILVIGMPLLLSVSREQFQAVLAHEIGHISGAHGKFGVWLWRQLGGWSYLMYDLERRDQFNIFVFGFYIFYLPRLWIRGFALNRLHEYEADRVAAQAIGAERVAEAIVQIHLADYAYQHRAAGNAEMPDEKQRVKWLNDALAQPDPLDDPHPSLANNLRSLGVVPKLPDSFTQCAGEVYFRDRLTEYTQIFGIPLTKHHEDGPQTIEIEADPALLPPVERPAPTPGVMRKLGE
jgi:Zn-dependent protease with chaperone function